MDGAVATHRLRARWLTRCRMGCVGVGWGAMISRLGPPPLRTVAHPRLLWVVVLKQDMGRETLTALYNAFLMGQPPQVAKHVLVCGLPDDLENFVTPLRSRDVGDHVTPIVILALRKPTMRSFSRIMDVPKLHYYYGSPRDPGALRDACLGRASTIVILANPSRSDDDDFVSEEDLMVDADAMTTLRYEPFAAGTLPSRHMWMTWLAFCTRASRMRRYVLQVTEKMQSDRRPHVVVELVRTSNIKFVQYQKASFSSDASRFDYYDESDEEDDFESLRHGTDELELMLRPAYASGQVCTSHFMEGLLGTSFHKRYAVRVTQLLLRGITEESRRSTSQSPQHSDSGVLNQNQNAESKASFGSQSSEDGWYVGSCPCIAKLLLLTAWCCGLSVLHSVRVPPWAHRQSVMDVFTRLAQKHVRADGNAAGGGLALRVCWPACRNKSWLLCTALVEGRC